MLAEGGKPKKMGLRVREWVKQHEKRRLLDGDGAILMVRKSGMIGGCENTDTCEMLTAPLGSV